MEPRLLQLEHGHGQMLGSVPASAELAAVKQQIAELQSAVKERDSAAMLGQLRDALMQDTEEMKLKVRWLMSV